MRKLNPIGPGVIVSVRETPSRMVEVAPDATPGVTGEQCRAGRRLLGWSLAHFAHVAGLNTWAVGRFERGETIPRPEVLAAITGALEAAGVELTADGARPSRP